MVVLSCRRPQFSRGLSPRWMFCMFFWYLGGALFSFWYYMYEALSHDNSTALFVTFCIFFYGYETATLLLCLVWRLCDASAQKCAQKDPPSAQVLRYIYLRRRGVADASPPYDNSGQLERTLYIRHYRLYHYTTLQLMAGIALVNICVGIFFMAYAREWESFSICCGLLCYPALLLLPLLCYNMHKVVYQSPERSFHI